MADSKNPFGLHTITPYLIVKEAKRLLDFLTNVFDGELRGEAKYRDDGSVQHVEIKIGDSVIMMGEPSPDIPEAIPTRCGLYVYVANCDAVYEKALKSGGRSIAEPTDYPHGDRFAGIEDFAGNSWWIVTHIGE